MLLRNCFFSILFLTQVAFAAQIDWNTYLRASTGSNFKGGKQECLQNNGASDGRLGNECGIYGEFSFTANILKGPRDIDPFWKLKSTFAFAYDNKKDWEAPNTNNWVLRELYSEGGNVDGMRFSAWVGKRFWRWGDVHMLDFYPVDMSGPGGGLIGSPQSWGKWSLTLIQNTASGEINNGSGTAASNVTTSIRDAAKTSLHFRLDDADWGFTKASFWLAGALTPSTASATTTYEQASGFFVATKLNHALFSGNNELGAAFGNSVFSSMSVQGELVQDCRLATSSLCMVPNSNRFRVWDALTFDGASWSGQLAFAYDELTRGTSIGNKATWMSVGVQPIYWFTEHVGLAMLAGVSQVQDDADGFGMRNLMRFTIAPQMSLKKSYWGRPVLRAYYSLNSWNEALRLKYAAAGGNSVARDLQLHSIGLQTEVWF